jgi:tubulin monoglycylase TTLL3/8
MEMFGYDFMIDDEFNPWLIEINSSPTMEYSTKITTNLVQKVMEDTVKLVIDNRKTKKNPDTGGFTLIFNGKSDVSG